MQCTINKKKKRKKKEECGNKIVANESNVESIQFDVSQYTKPTRFKKK